MLIPIFNQVFKSSFLTCTRSRPLEALFILSYVVILLIQWGRP